MSEVCVEMPLDLRSWISSGRNINFLGQVHPQMVIIFNKKLVIINERRNEIRIGPYEIMTV